MVIKISSSHSRALPAPTLKVRLARTDSQLTTANPPPFSPTSQAWKKVKTKVEACREAEEAAARAADARQALEEAEERRIALLRPYYEELRKAQAGTDILTFPRFKPFKSFASVKPFWEEEDSTTDDEAWEEALESVEQDIEEYRIATRVKAITVILAANNVVPLSSLSITPPTTPRTTSATPSSPSSPRTSFLLTKPPSPILTASTSTCLSRRSGADATTTKSSISRLTSDVAEFSFWRPSARRVDSTSTPPRSRTSMSSATPSPGPTTPLVVELNGPSIRLSS
jgi:hypothetical protein